MLTIKEEQARNALKWKVEAIAKKTELIICDSTNVLLRQKNGQLSQKLKLAQAENWSWRLLVVASIYFSIQYAIKK